MKSVLFCTFHLFFFCPLFAQKWETLNIPPATRYDDVFFINKQKGWTCNSHGGIYRTDDGGETWVKQIDTFVYLRSIEFLNENVGFCGGLKSGSSLFRTTDGGTTWVNISNKLPAGMKGICGLSCPGGGVVYGVGIWSSPAYLITSSDSGKTWTHTDMSVYASALVDVFFLTPQKGWVSGTAQPATKGGVILYTSDGGLNWQEQFTSGGVGDYVWKIQTPDSLHYFASIERGTNFKPTEIVKSTDGGLTWSPRLVSANQVRLQMIGFLDSMHGLTGNWDILRSTNGGDTWQYANDPSIGYNRFFRLGPDTAIISGEQLYRYTRTPVSQTEPLLPDAPDFHTLRVSPNPSAGPITINIDLKSHTSVLLYLYALDGKEMPRLLWQGEHPPGAYSIAADLSPMPAGHYVLWFKTNEDTQETMVQRAPRSP